MSVQRVGLGSHQQTLNVADERQVSLHGRSAVGSRLTSIVRSGGHLAIAYGNSVHVLTNNELRALASSQSRIQTLQQILQAHHIGDVDARGNAIRALEAIGRLEPASIRQTPSAQGGNVTVIPLSISNRAISGGVTVTQDQVATGAARLRTTQNNVPQNPIQVPARGPTCDPIPACFPIAGVGLRRAAPQQAVQPADRYVAMDAAVAQDAAVDASSDAAMDSARGMDASADRYAAMDGGVR